MAEGKALDLAQAMPIEQKNISFKGSGKYKDIANADICIVTAGLARKPGMSRDDLLQINTKIIKEVALGIKEYAPNSIVIVITNPLDAMVYCLQKISNFPRERVMGMAGVLDSARFRTFISMETGISPKDISAFVLGGHGDTMVPLPRYSTVSGIPLPDYPGIKKETIDAIVERTRKGGGEIVSLLQTGSAFYAPAASAISMAEAILLDQKRVLPCAARCEGEYGYKGMFIGVPAILGEKGVESIIEIELTEAEKSALDRSADAVQSLMETVDKMIDA